MNILSYLLFHVATVDASMDICREDVAAAGGVSWRMTLCPIACATFFGGISANIWWR